MSNNPNYRKLSPPDDIPPTEWSWTDRRAEIYDMIERAGHYRNLQRSQRDLARRYDVALSTLQNDIQRVTAFQATHLGDGAEHELETLKNSAIQEYIENGQKAKAYYLMMNHYEILMEAGIKAKAADKHEVEHSGTVGWREYIESAETDTTANSDE